MTKIPIINSCYALLQWEKTHQAQREESKILPQLWEIDWGKNNKKKRMLSNYQGDVILVWFFFF